MREKLIELLADFDDSCLLRCTDCKWKEEKWCVQARLADHLIANGVTVKKKGKWDDSGRYQFMDGTKAIRCTECGCALTEIEYQKYFYNFCPVCGADMRGDTDGTEQ